MSILLTCDCPGCFENTPPMGSARSPRRAGWVCRDDGTFVCACSAEHLDRVLKMKRGAA